MDKFFKQAKNDYNKLCHLATKNNYEKLAKILNGYNNNGERFDVNFKSIRATVWNQTVPYVEPQIDIWDDEKTCCIAEEIDITAQLTE